MLPSSNISIKLFQFIKLLRKKYENLFNSAWFEVWRGNSFTHLDTRCRNPYLLSNKIEKVHSDHVLGHQGNAFLLTKRFCWKLKKNMKRKKYSRHRGGGSSISQLSSVVIFFGIYHLIFSKKRNRFSSLGKFWHLFLYC